MQLLEALKQVKVARGFMDEDTIPALALDKAIELLEQPFAIGDQDAHGQAIYGCVDESDCDTFGVPFDKIKEYATALSEHLTGDNQYDTAIKLGYSGEQTFDEADDIDARIMDDEFGHYDEH